MSSIVRAFRQPARPASQIPALINRETFDDVGLLTIGSSSYGYRCYPGSGECRRIVRLFTDAGFGNDSYDVSFHREHNPLCTCPDFVYRRRDEDGSACKHIRGVESLGLHKSDEESEAEAMDRAAETPEPEFPEESPF